MSWEVGAVVVGVILGILGIIQYTCNAMNFIVIEPFQKSITNLCSMVNEVRGLMQKLSDKLDAETRASDARFIRIEQTAEANQHLLESIQRRLEALECRNNDN